MNTFFIHAGSAVLYRFLRIPSILHIIAEHFVRVKGDFLLTTRRHVT